MARPTGGAGGGTGRDGPAQQPFWPPASLGATRSISSAPPSNSATTARARSWGDAPTPSARVASRVDEAERINPGRLTRPRELSLTRSPRCCGGPMAARRTPNPLARAGSAPAPPDGTRDSGAHDQARPQAVGDVIASGIGLVPVREDGLGDPPLGPDGRVVPGQAQLVGVVVVVVDHVGQLEIGEGGETVGHARWDEQTLVDATVQVDQL